MTLAERWNGTRWSIQHTPNPTGSGDIQLFGVSCTSASACMAVGGYDHRSLAERWNGSSWSIQPVSTPAGSTETSLGGVSCTSGRACTATGIYTTRTHTTVPLVERWNGTRWSVQRTPNPPGYTNIKLYGVSCTSGRACTAVGAYGSGDFPSVPIAERWNGSSWSIQRTPTPAGSTHLWLYGVSCRSGRACTAVGAYTHGSSPSVTLAESWNGIR